MKKLLIATIMLLSGLAMSQQPVWTLDPKGDNNAAQLHSFALIKVDSLGDTLFMHQNFDNWLKYGVNWGFVDAFYWKKNDNMVYVLSDSIGIGTNSPDVKLEISDDKPKIKLHSTNELEASAGTEEVARIEFEGYKNSNTNVGASIRVKQDGTWSAVTPFFSPMRIEFWTQDNSGTEITSPRLIVNSAGNVGVGVDPVYRLDVSGEFRLNNSSEGLNRILRSDANGLASWVDLSSLSGGTDDQILTLTNGYDFLNDRNIRQVDIENGNSIVIYDEIRDGDYDATNERNTAFALDGNDLDITDSGGTLTVDLSPYLDNTDDQTLSEVLAQGNDAGAVKIVNLSDPTLAQDAATKAYVDANDDSGTDDQTLSEVLSESNDAGAVKIVNLADPTLAQDAATKAYVDANADDQTLTEVLTEGNNAGAIDIFNVGTLGLGTVSTSSILDIYQTTNPIITIGELHSDNYIKNESDLSNDYFRFDTDANVGSENVYFDFGQATATTGEIGMRIYGGSGTVQHKLVDGNSYLMNLGGNLGIGSSVADYKLDVAGSFQANSINVNGAYTLPITDGSANQLLKTDGTGTVTWHTPSFLTSSSISDAIYNQGTWDAVTTIAPSKNAVRDKIESMSTLISANTAKVTNANHTGDVTGATTLTIANDAVTYAKMQNVVSNNVLLGNNSGAGGIVDELSATEVRTLLNIEDGATGDQDIEEVLTSGDDANGQDLTNLGLLTIGTTVDNGYDLSIDSDTDGAVAFLHGTNGGAVILGDDNATSGSRNYGLLSSSDEFIIKRYLTDTPPLTVSVNAVVVDASGVTTDGTLDIGSIPSASGETDVAVVVGNQIRQRDFTTVISNAANGQTAFGWGDHSVEGYLNSEVDGSITNEIQTLSEVLSEGNDAGAVKIVNLADPTLAQDAATKAYVDANDDSGTDDQTLSEVLSESNDAGAVKIVNLADPTLAQDAATKAYVDANDDNTNMFNTNGTLPSGATTGLTNTWNVDSNTFYLDGVNNRVGVKTNGPTSELDVRGSIHAVSQSFSDVLYRGINTTSQVIYNAIEDADGDGQLSLYNKLGTETFRINGNGNSFFKTTGNVGIGTSTPGSKLDIEYTGASNNFEVSRTDFGTTGSTFRYGAPNGDPQVEFDRDGNIWVIGNDGGVFKIQKASNLGAANWLSIEDNSGSVELGIGIDSPSATLDVVGNTELNGGVSWSNKSLAQVRHIDPQTESSGGYIQADIDENLETAINATVDLTGNDITLTYAGLYQFDLCATTKISVNTSSVVVYLLEDGVQIDKPFIENDNTDYCTSCVSFFHTIDADGGNDVIDIGFQRSGGSGTATVKELNLSIRRIMGY